MRHPRNHKKFEAMNDAQRLEYMATANRVTIYPITQVEDRRLARYYTAKVRGIIVSDEDTYKFETPEQAREFGWTILKHWKREYYSQPEMQPLD